MLIGYGGLARLNTLLDEIQSARRAGDTKRVGELQAEIEALAELLGFESTEAERAEIDDAVHEVLRGEGVLEKLEEVLGAPSSSTSPPSGATE